MVSTSMVITHKDDRACTMRTHHILPLFIIYILVAHAHSSTFPSVRSSTIQSAHSFTFHSVHALVHLSQCTLVDGHLSQCTLVNLSQYSRPPFIVCTRSPFTVYSRPPFTVYTRQWPPFTLSTRPSFFASMSQLLPDAVIICPTFPRRDF